MVEQKITSAATSVNQIPAVYKLLNDNLVRPEFFWAYVDDTLDYGGGKYDTLSAELAKLKVRNWVYDPFNRSEDHNKLVRRMLSIRPADHAFCSNVLNVIKEPGVRQEVLRDIASMTDPLGWVFITVYEGNRSSRGRITTKGWQANRPLKSYVREVRKVFREGEFCDKGHKILRVRGRR